MTMDATRQIIKHIVTGQRLREADEVVRIDAEPWEYEDSSREVAQDIELHNAMLPGYKGFYSEETGWVTWKAEWPSGKPHHEDVIAAQFPELGYAAALAGIPPRREEPSVSPGANKWEVYVSSHAYKMWSEEMRQIVEAVNIVHKNSQLNIEAFSAAGAEDQAVFSGTIRQYLDEWDEHQ